MANPTTTVTLLGGLTLTSAFQASAILMLADGKLVLDFDLACSGGPSTVVYYLEFSQDASTFYPECAEEDAGQGVVLMPLVQRTLSDNASTSIANNSSFKSHMEFVRNAQFARVQIKASAGTVVVTSLTAPYGSRVVAGS